MNDSNCIFSLHICGIHVIIFWIVRHTVNMMTLSVQAIDRKFQLKFFYRCECTRRLHVRPILML